MFAGAAGAWNQSNERAPSLLLPGLGPAWGGSGERENRLRSRPLPTPALSRRQTLGMPELPEVEIVARRLDATLSGAAVESVVAPGLNVMKTFDPPLDALVGREVSAVRRVGKMPVVEFGDLALLIHLMSAGRLRLFDKRASPKDRASRVLVRLEDGRELRLREFGTKQRAWAKLLATDPAAGDGMGKTLGPEAWA